MPAISATESITPPRGKAALNSLLVLNTRSHFAPGPSILPACAPPNFVKLKHLHLDDKGWMVQIQSQEKRAQSTSLGSQSFQQLTFEPTTRLYPSNHLNRKPAGYSPTPNSSNQSTTCRESDGSEFLT
ncbi:hypothetical protein D5086_016557 [Populus alba]|uniref:Uncharacterized protein n=1 Tax=Populus alba TaxID=43335 RepID=A0ACC4BV23_POPAL